MHTPTPTYEMLSHTVHASQATSTLPHTYELLSHTVRSLLQNTKLSTEALSGTSMGTLHQLAAAPEGEALAGAAWGGGRRKRQELVSTLVLTAER